MTEHSSDIPGDDEKTSAAIWAGQKAAEYRAYADDLPRMTKQAALDRADELQAEADALHQIATPLAVGTGGEAETGSPQSRFVDTLISCPDRVAVDASRHRLSLATKAGGLALALDVAETVQAGNSLERMLSHQVAAAHIAAIELQAESRALLSKFVNTDRHYALLTTESARLMLASARMMAATQVGILTLHRLRTAGRQTLIVQHVNVSGRGQAVVAGQVKGRRSKKAARDG